MLMSLSLTLGYKYIDFHMIITNELVRYEEIISKGVPFTYSESYLICIRNAV